MKRRRIMMRGQRRNCYISGVYNIFPISSPGKGVQTGPRAPMHGSVTRPIAKEGVKQ